MIISVRLFCQQCPVEYSLILTGRSNIQMMASCNNRQVSISLGAVCCLSCLLLYRIILYVFQSREQQMDRMLRTCRKAPPWALLAVNGRQSRFAWTRELGLWHRWRSSFREICRSRGSGTADEG